MKLLEDKIKSEGRVAKNGYLSLSGFLNHGIDPAFLSKLGAEIKRKFDGDAAAGIPLACFTAEKFKTNAVFARKNKREALIGDCWSAKIASYTAGTVYDLVVSKDCISSDDTVLIVDDFLAGGKETAGLIEIVRQSGAKLAGVAVAVEKTFKPGGALLRSKGIKLVSLTKISRLSRDIIEFEK